MIIGKVIVHVVLDISKMGQVVNSVIINALIAITQPYSVQPVKVITETNLTTVIAL